MEITFTSYSRGNNSPRPIRDGSTIQNNTIVGGSIPPLVTTKFNTMKQLKEFYLETYPTDELGQEISSDATFKGLLDTLENYEDVYYYIGVGDSLVRERLFDELASRIGITYQQVYDQWILSAEL